jgi:hypothetical protein
LLPLVLAAHRLDDAGIKAAVDLDDDGLERWVAEQVQSAGDIAFRVTHAAVVRALLRCVGQDGAVMAADVLAERGLDETATGAYQTPERVAELMVDLMTGPDGVVPESVFDPACGRGGLLVTAARRGALRLYGQELLSAQAAQAALRVTLADGTTPNSLTVDVKAGDSLRTDAFPTLAVGAVLCNPPYGNRDWGHDELAYDPRWVHGLPPRSESELAWAQHCLAHLIPGGHAALLLPPATAERTSGRRIRAALVRSGSLRAVISLPPGSAPPAHVGLHIWLLQRPDPADDPPQTVLFIDAAARTADEGADDSHSVRVESDWDTLRKTVLAAWSAYLHGVLPAVARAVPIVDLLDDTVDLTPARHVPTTPVDLQPGEYADAVDQNRAELLNATDSLVSLTRTQDCSPAVDQPRAWRTAAIADLLRGGALTLLRPAASRGGQAGRSSEPVDDPGVELSPGDVVLPELLRGPYLVRVADTSDAGQALGRHLFLLRPDPDRIDPWFLAGFLAAEPNVQAATTGSTIIRVDARKLRIPLLPLAEQRRYGIAFRRLHHIRTATDRVNRLAEEYARTMAAGFTSGALLPPGTDPTV